MELIESTIYPGTVAHFHALMQRLFILHQGTWVSLSGRHLAFSESSESTDVTLPTRGSWIVTEKAHPRSGHAGIEAYEQPDGFTKVDFLDGYLPGSDFEDSHTPIGDAFEEFCEAVIREALEGDTTPERQEHPDRRKRQKTIRELWTEGLTYHEIARKTFVSESTVKRELKKMGLTQK